MFWEQFAIILVTFFGLFLWTRTESRADIRHMDIKLEESRNLSVQFHKENRDLIETIRVENHDIITAIREDMKDFHGRLCAIEERNRRV